MRVAGNGDSHYGLVGGETPWSRSALVTTPRPRFERQGRVLAAGPNAMQVSPSGVHRSKGTDAARRHRATGPALAAPPRWWRRASSLRTEMLSVSASVDDDGGECGGHLRVSEHAVLRHGAPGWQQQVEVANCSAEATWSPGSGLVKRGQPTCTPDTRRRGRILWMKPGRSLWHLGAQR